MSRVREIMKKCCADGADPSPSKMENSEKRKRCAGSDEMGKITMKPAGVACGSLGATGPANG